jgi:hypothetical protein
VTTPGTWDAQAETFDAEPDHGLTDPTVREAWRALVHRRGTAAAEVAGLVRACRQEADVVPLLDPALWGRAVDDERFLVLSPR